MVAPDPNAYIPGPRPRPSQKIDYRIPDPWRGLFVRLEEIASVDATVAFHLAAFRRPGSSLSLPDLVDCLIDALAREKQIYMAQNAALLAQLSPTEGPHEILPHT